MHSKINSRDPSPTPDCADPSAFLLAYPGLDLPVAEVLGMAANHGQHLMLMMPQQVPAHRLIPKLEMPRLCNKRWDPWAS